MPGFQKSLIPIQIQSYGLLDYDRAMSIMFALHQKRCADEIDDTLMILEHPPVVTRGRRLRGQFFANQSTLEAKGVLIRDADRGGLLTYHGPGQAVIYPVLKLAGHWGGPKDLVTTVEKILLDFLDSVGVNGRVDAAHPGVWVGTKKIAALGFRIAEGVSCHGVCLNIRNDLDVYGLFEPCGLAGDVMTSLSRLWGREIPDEEYQNLVSKLATSFKTGLETKKVMG